MSKLLVIVALGAGFMLGGYTMRANIADAFAKGDGRTLCEEILRGH